MAVYKQKSSKFWWYNVSRGRGMSRLRGSTGKTDKAEAVAVEQVIRMAYAGTSPRDRLISVIDGLMGGSRAGLPLDGLWTVYEGWLSSAGKKVADITCRQRKRACERFAKWASENWPAVAYAGAVDRACAAGFSSWLAVKKMNGSVRSGKTRRNIIGDLGTVWEGLKRVRDDITSNPWSLVLPESDTGDVRGGPPRQVGAGGPPR